MSNLYITRGLKFVSSFDLPKLGNECGSAGDTVAKFALLAADGAPPRSRGTLISRLQEVTASAVSMRPHNLGHIDCIFYDNLADFGVIL